MRETERTPEKERELHIMTSSDGNLIPSLSVLLHSIGRNLRDRRVHFYLMHSRVGEEELERLRLQCARYGNLEFCPVAVPVIPEFILLDQLGKWNGQGWPEEAYYPLAAWKFLPESLDRVLYLDAGDTLVLGEIDDYYFGSFQGCSLRVTGSAFKRLADPIGGGGINSPGKRRPGEGGISSGVYTWGIQFRFLYAEPG